MGRYPAEADPFSAYRGSHHLTVTAREVREPAEERPDLEPAIQTVLGPERSEPSMTYRSIWGCLGSSAPVTEEAVRNGSVARPGNTPSN